MSHPEYCLVCGLRKVPDGCGQHDCADGQPPNRFVPFYGRPPTHYQRHGCHDCRHRYVLHHFEGGQEIFCHLDGSYRPPHGDYGEYPGSWCEVFFDDVLLAEPTIIEWDELWHNAMGMYVDAWRLWEEAHRVNWSDCCHKWQGEYNMTNYVEVVVDQQVDPGEGPALPTLILRNCDECGSENAVPLDGFSHMRFVCPACRQVGKK